MLVFFRVKYKTLSYNVRDLVYNPVKKIVLFSPCNLNIFLWALFVGVTCLCVI